MARQKGLPKKNYKLIQKKNNRTPDKPKRQINEQISSARYIGVKIKVSPGSQSDSLKIETVNNISSAKIKILIAGGETIDRKISEANDSLYAM